MQESRQFKILYHLLDKGHATASELAKKLEVSVRTIYRDIDALSVAGIPVYAEPGRSGGIHLLDGFILDRTFLSAQEKQDIVTALQSITAAGSIRESDVLEKLSAIFRVPSENWFEVDFSRWGGENRDNEKFELLKWAVLHCKCVRIIYADSTETISERTIQPLKLSYKARAWYVKAYCAEKQDYRIFKLTRILELDLLEEGFAPQSFVERENSEQAIPEAENPGQAILEQKSSGQAILEPENPPQPKYDTVILRFPREMAYRVYDEFDTSQIERQKDGCLAVSAQMPVDNWLVSFLLSFGTQVEIMEPVDLKKVVAEQARMIYEKNKP